MFFCTRFMVYSRPRFIGHLVVFKWYTKPMPPRRLFGAGDLQAVAGAAVARRAVDTPD